jgi:hypothetical protein
MTRDGWRELVIHAMRLNDLGDPANLDLLAKLLTEQDQAKQGFRDLGFGCIGASWRQVVQEVREFIT